MKRTAVRKTMQFLSIALIILIPVLNRKGVTVITGTMYSMAFGPVWVTDPVMAAQTILLTLALDSTLLLSVVIPTAAAFALGRVFCSWLCPQNTLSELFDRLAGRIGGRRLFKPLHAPLPRYLVLGALLLATRLFGLPLVSLLSAPGIISVQTAKFVYESAVGLELSLIGFILIAEFFLVRRVWCNHLCPVGGFLGLLRMRRTMKLTFSKEGGRSCAGCKVCVEACGLGLDPRAGNVYPFCHNCGDCVAACERVKEKSNPLRFTF